MLKRLFLSVYENGLLFLLQTNNALGSNYKGELDHILLST